MPVQPRCLTPLVRWHIFLHLWRFRKFGEKSFPYLRVHCTSYICRVCKPANHSASISPDNKYTKTVPVKAKYFTNTLLGEGCSSLYIYTYIYIYIYHIYISKLFTPNISGVFSRHALEAPAASAGQQDLGSDSVSIGAASTE